MLALSLLENDSVSRSEQVKSAEILTEFGVMPCMCIEVNQLPVNNPAQVRQEDTRVTHVTQVPPAVPCICRCDPCEPSYSKCLSRVEKTLAGIPITGEV